MASPSRVLILLALGVVAGAGCTVHKTEAPPLSGPSELSLSLTLAAEPDTIAQDGISQSQVVILARDANSQPVRSLPVRVDIAVGGVVQDFGRLSSKNVVTGGDGKATVTYTAPEAVDTVDHQTLVSIQATPSSTDATAQQPRSITIKLVPSGVITPPGPNVPNFVITPASPKQMEQVQFDASDPSLDARLTAYAWSFGDGNSGSGRVTSHQYRDAGSYVVTLTVTDTTGASGSRPKTITVGQTTLPTPKFNVSPSAPDTVQDVFFNASESTAGEGRDIVSYSWSFGDGASGSGRITSHQYSDAGTYVVTLTVTDDVGNEATTSQSVAVGILLVPAFTFSPTPVAAGVSVNFNASGSTSPDPIVDYRWNWGDGKPPGSGKTVPHKFDTAGTYVVTLTITDSNGRTATVTQNVSVS